MIEITPKILAEVEEFASALLSPEEVAIITGIPTEHLEEELISGESDLAKAYLAGVLKTRAKVNAAIIKLANQGSSPAQAIVMDLISEEKAKRAIL
ncbi:MAG: hypothetical protein EOO13_09800 [Chitinophagaceae bacterium]|nr:MAG: hypothetical protein EOO13_09800 [Chitinophagaceae bacterium]